MFVATDTLSFHERAADIPFTYQFSMGFTQLLTGTHGQTFDDWLRATNEFSIGNMNSPILELNPMTIENHNIPFLITFTL